MDFRTVLTTCPYCAVGCNLVLQVLDGQIVGTLPAKTGPSMVDSSTWAAAKKEVPDLKILFKGDKLLVNTYHALCQPTGATPATFHRHLSMDIGQPDLRDHLLQVIALLRASANWNIFKRLFVRAFPTKEQLEEQRQKKTIS